MTETPETGTTRANDRGSRCDGRGYHNRKIIVFDGRKWVVGTVQDRRRQVLAFGNEPFAIFEIALAG